MKAIWDNRTAKRLNLSVSELSERVTKEYPQLVRRGYTPMRELRCCGHIIVVVRKYRSPRCNPFYCTSGTVAEKSFAGRNPTTGEWEICDTLHQLFSDWPGPKPKRRLQEWEKTLRHVNLRLS